jgi:hypothetical protein
VLLILLQLLNFNGCHNVNTTTSKIKKKKIESCDIEIPMSKLIGQLLDLLPNSHEFESLQDH